MAAQKIHATTQKFTEVVEFADNFVVLEGDNACMVIELTASNFALLSKREQDMRVFAFASLLNSLSFPIQILVRNKRLDISLYLKELDSKAEQTKNQQLKAYIQYYRSFVQEMVTVNVVLNKSFYIIIPYSSLEAGVSGAVQSQQKGKSHTESFIATASKILQTKADSLIGQVQKFATSARVLEKEDLIKIYYEIYNGGATSEMAADQIEAGTTVSIIKGGAQ
jgi:hypothetical protein